MIHPRGNLFLLIRIDPSILMRKRLSLMFRHVKYSPVTTLPNLKGFIANLQFFVITVNFVTKDIVTYKGEFVNPEWFIILSGTLALIKITGSEHTA